MTQRAIESLPRLCLDGRRIVAAAAEAQKASVLGPDSTVPVGSMRVERWAALIAAMTELGIVEDPPAAASAVAKLRSAGEFPREGA